MDNELREFAPRSTKQGSHPGSFPAIVRVEQLEDRVVLSAVAVVQSPINFYRLNNPNTGEIAYVYAATGAVYGPAFIRLTVQQAQEYIKSGVALNSNIPALTKEALLSGNIPQSGFVDSYVAPNGETLSNVPVQTVYQNEAGKAAQAQGLATYFRGIWYPTQGHTQSDLNNFFNSYISQNFSQPQFAIIPQPSSMVSPAPSNVVAAPPTISPSVPPTPVLVGKLQQPVSQPQLLVQAPVAPTTAALDAPAVAVAAKPSATPAGIDALFGHLIDVVQLTIARKVIQNIEKARPLLGEAKVNEKIDAVFFNIDKLENVPMSANAASTPLLKFSRKLGVVGEGVNLVGVGHDAQQDYQAGGVGRGAASLVNNLAISHAEVAGASVGSIFGPIGTLVGFGLGLLVDDFFTNTTLGKELRQNAIKTEGNFVQDVINELVGDAQE